MSGIQDVYLALQNVYNKYSYRVKLTQEEYTTIKDEFRQYNDWYINEVLGRTVKGKPMLFDPELDYKFVTHSPAYDTVSDDHNSITPSDSELLLFFDTIAECIVNKFNPNGGFSIGYKLLPMTKHLMESGRIKVEDGKQSNLFEIRD